MKKAGASCTKNAILFYDGHFSLVHLTKKYFKTVDIDGECGIMTTVIAKGAITGER